MLRRRSSARNLDSRASRQYPCLHNHAMLSRLWHAEFHFRSFISICLFTADIQYCLARSAPFPAAALQASRPGGQHARPRRRRQPRPASGAAGAGHGHVPGGSAPVLAAGAGRGLRPVLAVGVGSDQLPAPLAPATATSRGALGSASVLARRRPRSPAAAAGAGRSQRSSPLCMSGILGRREQPNQ